MFLGQQCLVDCLNRENSVALHWTKAVPANWVCGSVLDRCEISISVIKLLAKDVFLWPSGCINTIDFNAFTLKKM